MADCDYSIDPYVSEDGEMEVIEKYQNLMTATLEEGSLYERSKDTMFQLFDKLNINDKEKAQIVAQNISQIAMQLSASSMQSAVMWAKEERDGAYQNALIKAQTNNQLGEYVKIEEEICLLQKEGELKCVTIEATMASSIRDNGRVSLYDAEEPCKPIALEDEGLKYYQTRQVEADSYRIFADSYRKSGVVQIGLDINDQVEKGLTGNTHDEDGDAAGYTAQQVANAERQRIAYEDSKANHAANSSASMIGQMLSAEVAPAAEDVQRWRDSVDRLLATYATTPVV